MPHGGPDWSTAGPLATVYTLEDMAELAARLGSSDVFVRTGNVLFLDGFEDTLSKWSLSGDAGYSIIESAEHSRFKSIAAKMSTVATANKNAVMTHYMPFPVLSKFGAEVSFSFGMYLKLIQFGFYLTEPGHTYEASIRWSEATLKWSYKKDAVTWVDLTPTQPLYVHYDCFHTIKLVVDFVAKEHVSLQADNLIYDLSGVKLYHIVPPFDYWFTMLQISQVTKSNDVSVVYIDDVILTQNEP